MYRDWFIWKSLIFLVIGNCIWRDLIYNFLYLIFLVDVLGMISLILVFFSRGFVVFLIDG